MYDLTGLTAIGYFSGGSYTSESGKYLGRWRWICCSYVFDVETKCLGDFDKIQINMATSTGALSGLVDAAEGLDSLHIRWFIYFTESDKDLTVDETDKVITSDQWITKVIFQRR